MTIFFTILVILCLTLWLDFTIEAFKILGMIIFYTLLTVTPFFLIGLYVYLTIHYHLEYLALVMPFSVVLFLFFKRKVLDKVFK